MLSNGTVFFGAQQSSALTYFIPNQSPGSTFAFAGSTGAISGASSTVAVTTPSASEEPYMTYTIPKIKSTLLGSHDFTTPKTITFVVSAGATVSCEQAPGPAFSAWTACGGQLAGNVFTWSATDAVADIGFRFNLSAPSKPNRMYSFIPSKIYARHGVDFDVMNCNSTLTANGAMDFGDINSAQGSSAVVCLQAGTFTGTGGPIIPGSSDILLGKTDANGDPVSILQAVPNTVLAQVAANSLTFANLDMRGATSGAGTWLVNSENGTGSNFKSYNNIYRVNSFHTVGLRAHGDQGFDSYGDTFIVDGTTASTQGMVTTNSIVNRVYNIKSPLFKLSSHPLTSATFATGIRLWTSNSDMQIFDANVDDVLNEGTFLHVLNNGGGWTAAVTVQSSSFSLAGAGDNVTRFPILIEPDYNFPVQLFSIITS